MTDVKEQLKAFIITEVSPDLNLDRLDDDEPLIEAGIVDSLGMLKILAFLDETFGIDLSSGDINPAQFKDVRTICEMIGRQQST